MSTTNTPNSKFLVRHASLTEQVYNRLCNMLLTGDFTIDKRTSIRELASLLGTSTMPIREAISRLIAQGALIIEPNKAVRIPQMSAFEFIDLTNIRILTETEAVKKAIPLLNNQLLAKLDALQKDFDALVAAKEENAIVKQNKIFHFVIYEAAQSPTLMKIININWLRAGPMIHHDIGLSSHEERSIYSAKIHQEIVHSLKQKDSAAACHFLKLDILGAAKFILKNLMAYQNVEDIKWN